MGYWFLYLCEGMSNGPGWVPLAERRARRGGASPLGDDGLGDVLGAVVSLLHQPPDLLRTEVKDQPAQVRTVCVCVRPHLLLAGDGRLPLLQLGEQL